jgi:hypothetical protein
MKDVPIIFSAPMVRALIDGRKTMTRRLRWVGKLAADGKGFRESVWGRVKPGDRLWVRENFSGPFDIQEPPKEWPRTTDIWYWADGNPMIGDWQKPRPSIHMPRQFSRLTLTVTATKVERLQEITEIDAIAEGFKRWTGEPDLPGEVHYDAARDWFSDLWEDLHSVESWRANPDVVALSFRVAKINIDEILSAGRT